MNTKYINLIDQTYYFPQEEFTLEGENLKFHGIPLMDLVEEYGSPLKFTYLPKISENINKAKEWFKIAMEKNNYKGKFLLWKIVGSRTIPISYVTVLKGINILPI